MWKLKNNFGIGGLREIGFYEDSNYLLVLSSQGRGLFDCWTGEKISRDTYDYYMNDWNSDNGIVKGIGHLIDKDVLCGGFEFPDILNKKIGEDLKTEVVKEIREIWNKGVKEIEVLYINDNGSQIEIYAFPYGIDRAYGFSKNGNFFVLGTSSDLFIWTKEKE